jgi:GAF domain-containing protein
MDSYRQILEQFAVKAQLVAPILKNNQLLGLLIAHQCSESRNWQQDDIDLFAQLATQIGFAIEQVTLLEEMEKTNFEEV